METKPKNNKQKLVVLIFGISLFLLGLSTPCRSVGYFVGSFLVVFVSWTIILGAIAYSICWCKKIKKHFFLIFSILFLIAAILKFTEAVFKGYVTQKVLASAKTSDTAL